MLADWQPSASTLEVVAMFCLFVVLPSVILARFARRLGNKKEPKAE
jgi:hypothetical protein